MARNDDDASVSRGLSIPPSTSPAHLSPDYFHFLPPDYRSQFWYKICP
jgi:hypothetical protein